MYEIYRFTQTPKFYRICRIKKIRGWLKPPLRYDIISIPNQKSMSRAFIHKFIFLNIAMAVIVAGVLGWAGSANANVGGWTQGDAATSLAKDTSVVKFDNQSMKITNGDATQAFVFKNLLQDPYRKNRRDYEIIQICS